MWRRACASITIGLALTFGLASDASAQSPFIIDGTVPANGVPPGAAVTPDPFGSAKELGTVNGNATKVGVVHSALPPGVLEFTNPNGQVDLKNVWMQTAKDLTNTDQWLYFAWERDSRTGSGVIAFEFQQAALSPSCVYTGADVDMVLPASAGETALVNTCNPFTGRAPGDFLIVWDQNGGSTTIIKRTFESSPAGLVLSAGVVLASAAAQFSTNGFFGEATINLTDDVFPPGGACVNFANIIPGTITGNSDTADYKDIVLAPFPDISNCGTVTVTKVTEAPADLQTSFSYDMQRGNAAPPVTPIRYDGTTNISDSLKHGELDEHIGLLAGTDYKLTETVPAGWELVSTICTRGGVTYSSAATSFAVEAGETTACTIRNRRQTGTLKVIKIVTNNNGGTAVPGDFTMYVGNPDATSFAGSATGVVTTMNAGTLFNVSESSVTGYTQASAGGDCSGQIVVNVEKVCTITNTDNPPSLTLNKIVVNDNGGTQPESAWTLTANGGAAGTLSGPGAPVNADVVSGATFQTGSYALSESGPSGYTAGSWSCVGGTQNGAQITVGLGQSATCTITNDDNAPSLTLNKVVVNDNGGTQLESAWTLTANGGAAGTLSGPGAPGNTDVVSGAAFKTGNYALSESGPASGYDASAWVCVGGTQNGSQITVGLGQSAVCTITNDDVKAAPAVATAQKALLFDTATLSGLRPGAPNAASATVTFSLWSTNNCAAGSQAGGSETVGIGLVNNVPTASTLNGIVVTGSGTHVYYWKVEYSGDQYNASNSSCGAEQATVTFVQ